MGWEAELGADRAQTQQGVSAELGGHRFPVQPRRVQEHSVSHSLAASHPCSWQEPGAV